VLHRGEAAAEDLVRETDLLGVGVRDTGPEDLALVEQLADRAHGVRGGDARVRAVELVETDGLDVEALEGGLARALEVGRVALDVPGAVAGAAVPALGRDEDLLGAHARLAQGLG